MLRTIIVDDEAVAGRMLAKMLEAESDLEVLGIFTGGEEAVDAIADLDPDLIFLDIRMPGLNGFDVLERIPEEQRPAVIFVTAHDEYAVEAFRVRAVDYLLKPFDDERLRETMDRARERLAVPGRQDMARRLAAWLGDGSSAGGMPRRLAVKDGEETVLVHLNDVDWIEALANYVRIHAGRSTYLARGTLKGLESRLDPARFARIHRGTIVNVDRIARLSPLGHGDQTVLLKTGARLTASRRYRERLERLLQKL